MDYHRRLAALESEGITRHRARLLDEQRKQWTTADLVLIAKIERVRPKPARRDDYWTGLNMVTLRPIGRLKGERKVGRFDLYHTSATDCGPYGGGDAPQGKVGDLFVVYLNPGRPSPKTLVNSYAVDNVEDPAIKTALKAINK